MGTAWCPTLNLKPFLTDTNRNPQRLSFSQGKVADLNLQRHGLSMRGTKHTWGEHLWTCGLPYSFYWSLLCCISPSSVLGSLGLFLLFHLPSFIPACIFPAMSHQKHLQKISLSLVSFFTSSSWAGCTQNKLLLLFLRVLKNSCHKLRAGESVL